MNFMELPVVGNTIGTGAVSFPVLDAVRDSIAGHSTVVAGFRPEHL
jgi:hypothetical protein